MSIPNDKLMQIEKGSGDGSPGGELTGIQFFWNFILAGCNQGFGIFGISGEIGFVFIEQSGKTAASSFRMVRVSARRKAQLMRSTKLEPPLRMMFSAKTRAAST